VTPPGLRRLAEGFWRAAGGEWPFPRDLEGAVPWALPLAVQQVPGLRVRDVEVWLNHHAVPLRLRCPDRPLRGCLVAHAGRGVVLLDALDPADERRLTLAHEVAHFLLDYREPRRRAERRLGRGILAVLDGLRPSTLQERADAMLSGVRLGVCTHLLDRGPGGVWSAGAVADSEHSADRLALELLAPADEVWRRVERRDRPARHAASVAAVVDALHREFGLPAAVAEGYGRALGERWFGGPSIREWLGLIQE
jgi:hypothetical protein